MDMRTNRLVLLAADSSWLFRGVWLGRSWSSRLPRWRAGLAATLAGVAVVWHMAWHFSLVHVSLVAGVSAWTLCHSFSLLGEQSHFSRQQMPWLWGISALLFPAVSMCLLGRPAFSRPPRKWPALAHVLPGWPRYGKWLRFSVTPFGEISWRFGVASGSSLCRTAEGVPRCSDGCLLSSVTLTDFLFFLQPWARWPSVWRGSPGVTPAIWGRSVSCWGFYVFWRLQEVLGRQRDGVWVPGGWLWLESVLGWPRPCRWHDTLLSFSRANGG